MNLKLAPIVFATIFASVSSGAGLPKCVQKKEALAISELFPRLAYAETLASNCPDRNSEILPVVVGVVQNRINARKGDVSSVVFEKNQFASSLHDYKESRLKDFLCPKNLELWKSVIAEILSKKKSNIPPTAFHYYFFRHSERFTPPAWALGPDSYTPVVLDISEGQKPCIRAYVNPSWK